MRPTAAPRRRGVVRAVLAWLALAWLLVAIANLLFPAVGLPMAAVRWLLGGLAVGAVVVGALAWRHAGPHRDAPDGSASTTGRRIDQATIVLVLAALSLSLLHQFIDPFAKERAATAAATAGLARGTAVPPDAGANDAGAAVAAPAEPAMPVDPHSIAVLPFENLSPAPDDAYFADGLAEELLGVLARIDGLKVTSRSSSFAFRDTRDTPQAIAAKLGVASLLEGSVRRQGEDVRIAVRLVDAASGEQRWAGTYDRTLRDIFRVQEEISQAVADALATTLGVRTVRVAAPTADLAAYEQYLRGRQLFMQRGSNLAAARGLLEDAVARDPQFADAWAALAGTWYVWRAYGPEPDGVDTLDEAARAADRALALDADHPGALAVASRLAADGGDPLRAVGLIERALAREPNNANTWLWKGLGEYEAGHVRAAHASFQHARQLDPLSGLHLGWVGITTPDDPARTEALLREAHALGWRGPASRGRFLLALAGDGDARDAFLAWLHDDDTLSETQRALGRRLASSLHDPALRDAAGREVAAAAAAAPDHDWTLLLEAFGRTDEAIAAALAADRADAQALALTLWYDAFAPLRAHPRFAELARRRGFFAYWRELGPPDGCSLEGTDPDVHLSCGEGDS